MAAADRPAGDPGGDERPAAALPDEISWLTTQEAARRLGITTRTLYRFIDDGDLPAYRMGRVIRLQRHEVDDFIRRSRITPGSLEHLHPDPPGAPGPQ